MNCITYSEFSHSSQPHLTTTYLTVRTSLQTSAPMETPQTRQASPPIYSTQYTYVPTVGVNEELKGGVINYKNALQIVMSLPPLL